MAAKLDDLGWPEAELFDMNFLGGVLRFKMLDLLAYGDPLKFEVVEISIKEIEALRIEMTPYRNGCYSAGEVLVQIGDVGLGAQGFEGISRINPFSGSKADYFWVDGALKARETVIFRTGEYVFKPRAC